MATTLTIASGPLTSTVTAANDTKAQEVLRRFALATGAPPDATNQQLLNWVTQEIKQHMVAVARRHYRDEQAVIADTGANDEVGF